MAIDFKKSYRLITWDIDRKLLNVSHFGKVDDTGRGLKVKLIQNSQEVEVTTETLRLFCEKPDRTRVFIDATLEGNEFNIELTNQVYAVPGVVKAELKLNSNGKWISSDTFFITVKPNLVEASIMSSNEFNSLLDALSKVDNWDNQFQSKYDGLEQEYAEDLTQVKSHLAENTSLSIMANTNRLETNAISSMNTSDSLGYVLLWMDENGTLYARLSNVLYKSVDNGSSYTLIHTFPTFITGVRSLANGELIVSTLYGTGVEGKLYSSSNNLTTWNLVVTCTSDQTSINNEWGMSVYENIAVVSEYGTRGQATKTYLSEDYGQTFTLILDATTYSSVPSDTHIHGSFYDKYWGRIWVTYGDNLLGNGNYGLLYSDDLGTTWVSVPIEKQLLNIFAFEDCVIFGSDSVPNGIYVYNRTIKSEVPIISLVYKIDDSTLLSYMPFFMYKKNENEPCYISITFQSASEIVPTGSKIILSTYNGRDFKEVWRDTDVPSHVAAEYIYAFAPTTNNKLVGTMKGDSRYTNPTKFNGDIESRLQKATQSIESKMITNNPYLDARWFGIKGDGTDETSRLTYAINYVANNHKILGIPKELTITVRNVIISEKSDFGLFMAGTLKFDSMNNGVNANALKLVNCNNVNIYEFNFNGNIENNPNDIQPNHNGINLENCQNIEIGVINGSSIGGNMLYINDVLNLYVKKINGTSENTGKNIVYLRDGEDIVIDNIYTNGVGEGTTNSVGISLEPNDINSVIKNVKFKNIYMKSKGIGGFHINNSVGASVSNVNLESLDIQKGTDYVLSTSIINVKGVKDFNANIKISSDQVTPSLFASDGLYLNDIDGFDINLDIKNLVNGVTLGYATEVANGKIKGSVKSIYSSGVKLCKMRNVDVEGLDITDCNLSNSGACNLTTVSAVTAIDNLKFKNCKFGKGLNNFKNINMLGSTVANVRFENCDFSEWSLLIEKIDRNTDGIFRLNNTGLNFLSVIPTTGYWKQGEVIYNTLPAAGGYLGWVCVTAGSPGTWKGFGLISS